MIVCVKIPYKQGLHARNAIKLVNLAKQYHVNACIVKGNETVELKNLIGILGLQLGYGDEISIKIEGEESETFKRELLKIIDHS